ASSRVATASANVLVSAWRIGRLRPYATIGAGIMSIHIVDVAEVYSTSEVLAAINGGAGVVADLGSHWGLRGDLRHFRTRFDDPPAGGAALGARFIHTWRVSFGVVRRF